MRKVQIVHGDKSKVLPLADPLVLEAKDGLARGTLQLAPHPLGAVLECTEELEVGGVSLRPGSRRLLRPGEQVKAAGISLLLEEEPSPVPATRLLARGLLGGDPGCGAAPEVPRLIWLTGPDLGRALVLEEGATFLGRGPGCAARINDPRCSRAHAKLVRSGPALRLVDLGAANGMHVNGARRTETVDLRGGDIVRVGATLLRVELPRPAPDLAPPPPAPSPALHAVEPEPEPEPTPPAPEPAAAPEPPAPRSLRLATHERLLLGTAALAVLVGGALVGWAVR